MDQYANLKLKVDSTDVDEAERELNDLTKAGARTEKATDSLAASSKKFSKQTKQTTGNVRLMKGGVQQLGFQVQDIAVQLQGGTNAMVVLGQQGSQIASLFGPAGAIAGAVLAIGAAVGGTLVGSMLEAESATDKLEESIGLLDKRIRITKGGVAELTEDLKELAKQNRNAALLEIETGIIAATDAIATGAELVSEKLEDMVSPGFFDDADDLIEAFGLLTANQREASDVLEILATDNAKFWKIVQADASIAGTSIDLVSSRYHALAKAVEGLEDKYGATRSEAIELAQAFTAVSSDGSLDNILRLQAALDDIASNSRASDELKKLTSEFRVMTLEAEKNGIKIEKLKEVLSDLDSVLEESGGSADKRISAFERLNARLEEQVALYGKVGLEARIRYQIENGQIEGLTDSQGKVLIGLAKELDLKKKLSDQAKEQASIQEKLQAAAEKQAESEKKSFDRLQEFLKTEEQLVEESYKRRLEIILANTEAGSVAQEEMIKRLKEKTQEANDVAADAGEKATEDVRDIGAALARGMQSTVKDGFVSIWEGGFDDVLASFGDLLINLALEAAAADFVSALGFGGKDNKGGNLASFGNALFGGFAGFKDAGGHIGAGQFAVVGERRPELVTGPANVIGGAETAKLMNSNNSNTTNININYSGTGNRAEDRRAAGAFARDINNRLDSGRRYS